MKLEDLDIWSSNKAADIVFDVCIRHKLRFFRYSGARSASNSIPA